MNSYNITCEILNIPHVNQDPLSSLYPSQNIQKRFTNINSSSRRGKIIGKDGALIARSKSMSAPEFIRRRRTISEKEEENDKITPLPEFQRSRKWRSSVSLSSFPLS